MGIRTVMTFGPGVNAPRMLVGTGDPSVTAQIAPVGSLYGREDAGNSDVVWYERRPDGWHSIGLVGSIPWESITGKPTTIAGVGVTDVYTKAQIDAKATLKFLDTRNVVPVPGDGGSYLSTAFKTAAAAALPGGTYAAVTTFNPWTDDSGGGAHQLAHTNYDGRPYHRYGTRAAGWGGWRAYAFLDELWTRAQADGRYLPYTGGALTGALTAPRLLGLSDVGVGGGHYSNAQVEARSMDGGDVSIAWHRGGYSAVSLRHQSDGLQLLNSGNAYAPLWLSALTASASVAAAGGLIANNGSTVVARLSGTSDSNRGVLRSNALQLGNSGQNLLLAGNTVAGGYLDVFTNVSADYHATGGSVGAGVHAGRFHASGRVTFGSTSDLGYTVNVAGDALATGWYRVSATGGLLWDAYGGGWRMQDTTYIRTYGNKHVYIASADVYVDDTRGLVNQSGSRLVGAWPYWAAYGSASAGGLSLHASAGTLRGRVYWDANGVGLLNDTADWSIRCAFGAGHGGTLYGAWTVTGALIAASLNVTGAIAAASAAIAGTITKNGQPVPAVFSGTGPPSNAMGEDGDLYLQY